MTFKLGREIAPHFVAGLVLSAAVSYAGYTAFSATTTVRIEQLEQKLSTQQDDHDMIIRLDTNVASIKESITKIERAIANKQAASNVQ